MIVVVIARAIVGAVIGYFVGLLLLRAQFAFDNYRLKRRQERFDKHIGRSIA